MKRASIFLFVILSAAQSGCSGGAGGTDQSVPHDAGLRDAAVDLAVPEHRTDWIAIIGTGQSLSVGYQGTPVLTTQQPYHNLKLLDTGPDPKYPLDGGGTLSLVLLVELIRPMLAGYTDNQYPNNIFGETPHSAMANQLSALSLADVNQDYVTLHSVVGWSGHPITDIDKSGGGRAYPGSLSEARTFKKMADAAGKTFSYGAIVLTHGEADSGNPTYEAQVFQLYQDYNADLKAITGQTRDIPLLLSQQCTVPAAQTPSLSTQAEWRLGVDHPGQIICVGPKYQYFYADDHLHLDAPNYIRLAEKYAQVYYEVVVRGRPWQPLQPTKAALAGTVITLDFDVPVPPLNWDENVSPPHQTAFTQWKNGRGFEVADSTGPLTIDSVQIVGQSVQIKLAQAPAGTGLVVSYAMTQDAVSGNQGGTGMGRRGQLRDADPFVGQDAQTLSCTVTGGSTAVTCPAAGALATRSALDVVSGAGLPAGTLVAAKASDNALTLSQPWTGKTGTAALSFHHDQHNYCVQFQYPIQ